MVKPYVQPGAPFYFYWNVSANVGQGSPNLRDDLDLVQFAYSFLAVNPKVNLSAADRAIFAAVTPGGPCSGLDSDPLVKAIRRHQQLRGGMQDGHVSVIPPNTYTYPTPGGGQMQFMLLSLNVQFHDLQPDVYPRLDLIKLCPGALKATVAQSMLVGV